MPDPVEAPPVETPPVETPPVETPPVETPPVEGANPFSAMGEDWRGNLISAAGFEGDDAKTKAGQLERVLDVPGLMKNYFSAQDKIRSGEISSGLPEDPTDEQMSDWREANGIPAEAGGYELTLDDGLVLGAGDEKIMEAVYAEGHAGNVPTGTMNSMVNALLKGREMEFQALQQQDGVQKQQTDGVLREAWGSDHQTNTNMVQGLMSQLPDSVRENFENARLGDGRAMFNSPEMMVFYADIARKLNPSGTVTTNTTNPGQAIATELEALTKEMREDASAWSKNQAGQERWQKLWQAQEDMKVA